MANDYFDTMSSYARQGLDAARELSEIQLRTWERLMQKQVQMGGACMEASARSMDTLGKVKDYNELLSEQAKLSQECGSKWVDASRETAELLNAAGQELSSWMEKHARAAGEAMDKAVNKGA